MKIKAFATGGANHSKRKLFFHVETQKFSIVLRWEIVKAMKQHRKTLRLAGKLQRSVHLPEWIAKIIIFFHYFYSSFTFLRSLVLIPPNELSSCFSLWASSDFFLRLPRLFMLCAVFIRWFRSIHFDCVTGIFQRTSSRTRLWIFGSYVFPFRLGFSSSMLCLRTM